MSAYSIFREEQMFAHSFSGRGQMSALFFREGQMSCPLGGENVGEEENVRGGGKCPGENVPHSFQASRALVAPR